MGDGWKASVLVLAAPRDRRPMRVDLMIFMVAAGGWWRRMLGNTMV